MKYFATAVAICILVVSPTALLSQPTHLESLKGLRTFGVIVEGIDPNDCSLSTTDVDTALRFIASQSRMQLTSSPGFPDYLYVNVTIASDCTAAHVEVELNTSVHVITNGEFAIATIWSTGGVLTGRSSTMRQRVLDAVDQGMKRFVVDWSSENPPPR